MFSAKHNYIKFTCVRFTVIVSDNLSFGAIKSGHGLSFIGFDRTFIQNLKPSVGLTVTLRCLRIFCVFLVHTVSSSCVTMNSIKMKKLIFDCPKISSCMYLDSILFRSTFYNYGALGHCIV